jgi:hypothetical protein
MDGFCERNNPFMDIFRILAVFLGVLDDVGFGDGEGRVEMFGVFRGFRLFGGICCLGIEVRYEDNLNKVAFWSFVMKCFSGLISDFIELRVK